MALMQLEETLRT